MARTWRETARLLRLPAALAAAICLAAAGSTSAASSASGPAIEHWNGTAWAPVSSPHLQGALDAVAAISATDIWAVGSIVHGHSSPGPLTEHWNGSSWRQVAVPAPSRGGHGELWGVTATSPENVWAVGYWNRGTLIEHWNGKRWKRVASSTPGSISYLTGGSALSATNAWAVGWYANYSHRTTKTLVLHWNGTRWRSVTSPSPAVGTKPEDQLSAVAAVSTRDVWAVGNYVVHTADGRHGARTLALHWDGKDWTHITSPNPEARYSQPLLAVASAGTGTSKDWAVGIHQTGHGSVPLAERWDGRSWSIVPVLAAQPTSATTSHQELKQVAAVPSGDAWAVGNYSDGPDFVALLEHWDGSSWSEAPLLDPDRVGTLSGLAAVSADDVWAVGQYGNP